MKSEEEHKQEIRGEWDKAWEKLCPDVLELLVNKQETGKKVSLEDLYIHFFNAFCMGQVVVLGRQVERMERSLRDRGIEPDYPEHLRGPLLTKKVGVLYEQRQWNLYLTDSSIKW